MDRSTALETIRAARSNRGITYDDLAKKIGTKDATYLAAALHGQHRLNADEAKKLAVIERPLLAHALAITGGNQLQAARLLGMNRNTLHKRCRELGLIESRPRRISTGKS